MDGSSDKFSQPKAIMKFDFQIFSSARQKTHSIAQTIANRIQAGMNTADGLKTIEEVLKENGVEKCWHPSKFRPGIESLKTFRELPDFDHRLQEGDTYFIDIGPIIDGHEADYGESFILGTNEELRRLSISSKEVFLHCQELWRKRGLTGSELLKEARAMANSLNLELNEQMAGHRLSEFPHAAYGREKLFEWDQSPSSSAWVLEIHLISKDLKRGSFYEDLLIT